MPPSRSFVDVTGSDDVRNKCRPATISSVTETLMGQRGHCWSVFPNTRGHSVKEGLNANRVSPGSPRSSSHDGRQTKEAAGTSAIL